MRRAFHSGLAKCCVARLDFGIEELQTITAKGDDRRHRGRSGQKRDTADRGIRVETEHVFGTIASVTVLSHVYGAEYLHLARTEAGWKIVNVLWTRGEA
jgi:Putative lumazine-binding